jgi:hypothetical protein
MFRRTVGDRLLMSPMEPLVADGAAEAVERHLQQLNRYPTGPDPRTSLEDLSVQPVLKGAGVESVTWEHAERERA